MSYETDLQANNLDLQALIEKANSLPSSSEVLTQANEYTKTYVAENAAPAGFGLGGSPSKNLTTLEELDVVRGSGWYTFARIDTTINGVYLNYALVKFDTHSANQAWQELRPINTQTVLKRAYYNGTWSEWECDNPPMVKGVEYRTTERCNGRPVFKKLIAYNFTSQVGTSSTTVTHSIPHGISGFEQAIRAEAWKGNYIFPMFATNGGTTSVAQVDATNIYLRFINDYVGTGNMYISLAYLKTGAYQ